MRKLAITRTLAHTDMKLLKDPYAYLIGYAAMIAVTFGHAWKNITPNAADAGLAVFATVWSSFAWPLYWSVQLWK